MSFKPIDSRRDEYRKYLERTGVVESLSKVILELYLTPEPKPENAIEFIRKKLGDSMLESETIEHLKRELEDSQNEVANLERQLEALKLEMTKKPMPPLPDDTVTDSPVETSEEVDKDANVENDEKASTEETQTCEVESSVETTKPAEEQCEREREQHDEEEANKEITNQEALQDVQQRDEIITDKQVETIEETTEKKDNSEVAESESIAA